MSRLANYLPRTTRRTEPGPDRGVPATVWEAVLRRLNDDPDAAASATLTAALSTPLMVALARTAYSDRLGQDPEDLLDARRFPTRDALEEHLLASFIPAVYRRRPPPLSGAARPRQHRNWDPERARHWLGHLARHLDHASGRDSQDLAWWRLGSQLPPSTRVLAVVVGRCRVPRRPRRWSRVRAPARTLALRLLYGIHAPDGLAIRATLINMACFGIIFGLAGGLGLALVTILEKPVDTGTAATPASLLATNRATAIRQVLVTAPALAVMIGAGGWVIVGLLQPLLGPLTWSLPAGIVIGAIGGLSGTICYVLAFTAWG
jgi:hypothetical protein